MQEKLKNIFNNNRSEMIPPHFLKGKKEQEKLRPSRNIFTPLSCLSEKDKFFDVSVR